MCLISPSFSFLELTWNVDNDGWNTNNYFKPAGMRQHSEGVRAGIKESVSQMTGNSFTSPKAQVWGFSSMRNVWYLLTE